MISFTIDKDLLLLEYSSDDISWVTRELKNEDRVSLKNTFKFTDNHFVSKNDNSIYFNIAQLDDDYFKFDKDTLQLGVDLFIHKDIDIQDKFFFAHYNISIFDKIEKLLDKSETEIRIGNSEDDNFPIEDFKKLIKNFPNTSERQHYVNARIGLIIQEHFNTNKNYEEIYDKYMIQKVTTKGENILSSFKKYENDKYSKVLGKLEYMLENESDYDEKDWQDEILQIIQLLYPKYIRVFDNVTINDTNTLRSKYLDFMLVDSNGNIDIVEIKKPFSGKKIITLGTYRNNHVPVRELSGSIMQVEKYIYNLNRWGERGEKKLTENYKSQLPRDLKIKITNPCGIVVLGREIGLTTAQKNDLEIIKRKYKNVIDVITYDDLIQRLKNIIY